LDSAKIQEEAKANKGKYSKHALKPLYDVEQAKSTSTFCLVKLNDRSFDPEISAVFYKCWPDYRRQVLS
jgi:hypothetical protein